MLASDTTPARPNPPRSNLLLPRRRILRAGLTTAAALVGVAASPYISLARQPEPAPIPKELEKIAPAADSVIFIWLPGGVAQTDTWDPKAHTPFTKGMKGREMTGTCPLIATKADGVHFGAGLENLASVMDKGLVLRSLANDVMFGAIHLKAQYYMMTGYLFPAGVKAPSLGSVVARTRGRRDDNVPPYIYIGRDIDSSDEERIFINEFIGPGFYGIPFSPFMIPDATQGLATLSAAAGMDLSRLDRRRELLKGLNALADDSLKSATKAQQFTQVLEEARRMMDSPVKHAFDYTKDETPETIAAYEPQVSADELLDKSYYHGRRFGHGLLLARRLVESGARFIQVEYQYAPFKGFDMHESGATRMQEMKKQIDRSIAQLIKDLAQRGLLNRTLVVIATEFGRTLAAQPSAGVEPDGAAEVQKGDNLTLDHEGMYGFHGHFSSCNSMLFFGGGFKQGLAYGKTSPHHPMTAIENPVRLTDVHATIYRALGIAPDQSYITEGRPFYVTKDGKGVAVREMLA